MAQRILYPCYFNAALSRREGRRVSADKAAANPTRANLAAAARKAGMSPVEEAKSYPARAYAKEGRIIVEYSGSKERLIAEIAGFL